VGLSGEWIYEGHLWIAGYSPGLIYPRAYKVDVYLDGSLSFSEFFEVTNGGLRSPRTCGSVDENGNPVDLKSQFTIGEDAEVTYWLRFDLIAYFNDETGRSHSFTTVWVQPNGTAYETYSASFGDYKDKDETSSYWEYECAIDDYISINSSTPVGNWSVDVYVDSYYDNGTWMPYGPVATTPFTVENASKPIADWTFMVYLDGANDGESAAIDTFLKIASVGSSSTVNIVVQMARIAGWWQDDTWTSDPRFDNWTDCKRFYVTTDMTPTAGNATSDLGEVDMGNASTLNDFILWAVSNYPASHYCLVLWDHGAGFMGLCEDVTNNDFLSMSKLSQALSGLPVTLDVIVTDACSMAMLEVAYQVKDYANVIVGPEGLGYAPAPYDWYLDNLTANPSPTAFATDMVNDYMTWCNYERAIGNYQEIPNATMSAIDLTKITSLSAAVDDLALNLEDEETPYNEQICLDRNQTEEYPGPYEGNTSCYVDLYNFAQLVNLSALQNAVGQQLGDAAGQVMAAISECTIVAENISLPNSHGLSIFFPIDEVRFESFESAYENTAFASNTLWNGFLQEHLSGCLVTLQTIPAYPNVPVMVGNESYVTDVYGTTRVFVQPAYYTFNVSASFSTGPGSRAVFTQWEDGEHSNSRTLYVSGATTLTAEYQPQYQLVLSANLGSTTPPLGAEWYDANSTLSIMATAPLLNFSSTQEQYVFVGWNGMGSGSYTGTDSSGVITMNGPMNETATWRHEYYLTVVSPIGSSTPSSGWFNAGASILVSATPPTSEPTDTRQVCTGWSGTGSVNASGTSASTNISITEPSSITWNWETQYLVYVNTDPAGLNPQPNVSSVGPWYDEGTVLTCTAQNVSGKVFDRWTAGGSSYEPALNPINITVYGPLTATAHYLPAPAWWNNLLAPQNMPIVMALFLVLIGSSIGGAWLSIRRSRIKKARLEAPVVVPKTGPETPIVAPKEPTEAPVVAPKIVLPGRIATGCEDLDNLLHGGIPQGYSVALTSPSCDERSLLVRRFLEVGAKKGDVTFLVTIDPGELTSLTEEQPNFYLFVCNPQADAIVRSASNVFKLKGVENLTDISIALTSAIRKLDTLLKGSRRICISLVSDILLQHQTVQTRRWLAGLIPELRSAGFTTLAVLDPQMHAPQETRAILDLFEGEININEIDTGKGPLKFIKVKKMASQKYLEQESILRKESLEPQNTEKGSEPEKEPNSENAG
jgi:KaiC/GvpD/RAD55 family RecA-like ATPase